jgi:signal transduction histidine kinase/CheY-like chemotaxis protein
MSLDQEIRNLTGIGTWEWDIEKQSMVWSPEAYAIFEIDPESPIAPSDMPRLRGGASNGDETETLREALRSGTPWTIVHPALTARGRSIWIRSTGRVERVDGRSVRIHGLFQDVTDEQDAKADLEHSRRLLEELSALSGIGGWERDSVSDRVRWSRETRRIYEVDDAFEPSPESMRALFAPGAQEIHDASIQRATSSGSLSECEFDSITAKGRTIRVRSTCRVEQRAGHGTRIVGTAQDVTASRAAQAEMELLHARLTSAIEAAELRVWEIDAETGVLRGIPHLPPTFAQSGMSETIGAVPALNFIHPEDRVEFEQQVSRMVLLDQPLVSRIRVRAEDGSFRHIEIRMRLSSSGADRRKILGVSRDVTRDVTLTDELVRKQQEAEEASLAKGQFVARMSHEIRTPMSGVIGMLEVLLRAEVDQDKRAHAATALKSARDLMSVLDDIIDVSQLESRHLSLDNAPCSLSDVVEDVVSLFGSLARDKSLELTAEVAASTPEWVIGDARRVRQVLTNLVGNAVKFTDAGRIKVSVSYDTDQQVARFTVRDTGAGISEDIIDKVFDQFFQADSSTTRRHGGSGLGLAISRQLVAMMGGVIQVDSKPGEGSAFHFTIATPIALPPSPEREEPLAAPNMSLRVLVAEDNPSMQQILRALLEAGGHQLTVVSNGRDAVAMAASHSFDVILMDVMMPVMDGPTAVLRIRELGGRSGGIPIIALTASALAGDRDQYLAAGMTDYLSKPIDVAALFAALGRATARS